MKVAISTDGEFVSPHFGRCPSFTIVEIEGNKVLNKEVVANPGHHPGFLPQFLYERGVNCIIAGGMGFNASNLFAERRIATVVGISGKVDDVIQKLAEGTLQGGESLCKPGAGKGYGLDKSFCDHSEDENCH